ncbi:hypothetical protein RR48_09278 [Papilio machaon]|uniref:CRAL-TRIO domain-containing protein n=1 Tax=Papilio machaon TaxID=76193 RepID=A0A194RH40_PAPMA|nr:hypothetical protein RR48_09278 [Papilio machaon]
MVTGIANGQQGGSSPIAMVNSNMTSPVQTEQKKSSGDNRRGVVYQLDVALQSLETQRAGLVFIYDMTDSKYTNFDYELSQKILTMLKKLSASIWQPQPWPSSAESVAWAATASVG